MKFIKNKIDYGEMLSFADEIHKFLGNRLKMFLGFIGEQHYFKSRFDEG